MVTKPNQEPKYLPTYLCNSSDSSDSRDSNDSSESSDGSDQKTLFKGKLSSQNSFLRKKDNRKIQKKIEREKNISPAFIFKI